MAISKNSPMRTAMLRSSRIPLSRIKHRKIPRRVGAYSRRKNECACARRRLEEAQRRGAADEQQRAIDELKQAKAELEQILRQLREEEIERVLTQLGSRFRKMLQLQIEVYEGTMRLDRVPDDERDRDLEIEAAKLSRKEGQIADDAEQHAESVARGRLVRGLSGIGRADARRHGANHPAAIERQGRADDAGHRAGCREGARGNGAGLRAAQRDQQQEQAGGQKGQKKSGKKGAAGGDQQERPLVNAIAELKMIRALQMRVNTRTDRYSKLLNEGVEQADQPDLVEALQKLSQQEEKIHKSTRDIVVGRNQ